MSVTNDNIKALTNNLISILILVAVIPIAEAIIDQMQIWNPFDPLNPPWNWAPIWGVLSKSVLPAGLVAVKKAFDKTDQIKANEIARLTDENNALKVTNQLMGKDVEYYRKGVLLPDDTSKTVSNAELREIMAKPPTVFPKPPVKPATKVIEPLA